MDNWNSNFEIKVFHEGSWQSATLFFPPQPELERRVEEAVLTRYGSKPRVYHLGIMERKAYSIAPLINEILREEIAVSRWGAANAFPMRGSVIINLHEPDKIEFFGDVTMVLKDDADFIGDAEMLEAFIEWIQDEQKPFPLLKEEENSNDRL